MSKSPERKRKSTLIAIKQANECFHAGIQFGLSKYMLACGIPATRSRISFLSCHLSEGYRRYFKGCDFVKEKNELLNDSIVRMHNLFLEHRLKEMRERFVSLGEEFAIKFLDREKPDTLAVIRVLR